MGTFLWFFKVWFILNYLLIGCVAESKTKKNALLLAGAVSRIPSASKGGGNGHFTDSDSLYNSARPHSAVHVCANSIIRHMIKPSHTPFDIFIHTWSFDLETQFRSLYDFTAAEFEDNRLIENKMKALYPQFPWAEVSYTVSAQRVVQLMLQHEDETGFTYDRILLVRPDIFIHKDLDLEKLGRGVQNMYCNNHGKAAGDFHFVMEHSQAARLAHVLPLENNNSVKPYVVGGHNRMNEFASEELKAVMQNDNQINPGADEEVYRKVPWHLMLCNAADWWRSHMAGDYGMTEQDWANYEALGTTRPCQVHEPAQLLNMCCKQGSCVRMGEVGSENCGKRLA